ncbi:hypothetical protein N656DRAFT_291316 [Canariomyces notabilis]|uniref:Uncharacterized protein n=1 Tax=Canariomyces notabilis TaxID=2074819 RepID=A0AAN6QHJ2_9PEZI|nr:hypothetical protein N656DRAFT_291316 [Canariomyces arenarius]
MSQSDESLTVSQGFNTTPSSISNCPWLRHSLKRCTMMGSLLSSSRSGQLVRAFGTRVLFSSLSVTAEAGATPGSSACGYPGMLTPIFSLLGSDAAAHLAEEPRDMSRTSPRAMNSTGSAHDLNGAMGFIVVVTFCMVLGDVESVTGWCMALRFCSVSMTRWWATLGTMPDLAALGTSARACEVRHRG